VVGERGREEKRRRREREEKRGGVRGRAAGTG
jgi:hypothetical protein